MKKQQLIIGRKDRVDLPRFGLSGVPVKIDSGAYTSTIHCAKVEENEGKLEVVFLDKKEDAFTGEKVIFDEFSVKKVRSSSGQAQYRYKVKGNILLFGKKYNTEFTLSRRTKMRYPVLLGRKLLNKRFLIDTSLADQSWKTNTN
jgi:hypothetical protein